MRPNRSHQVIAWAVNSNNIDGTATGATSFTSANATTALSAPSVAVVQVQSREVRVDLGAVADVSGQPKFRRYVVFEQVAVAACAEGVFVAEMDRCLAALGGRAREALGA